MLDELARTRAIELRPLQTIRLKTAVAVEKGMTPQVIKAFGDRVTELMDTLLQNMRDPENSAFVASVTDVKVSAKEIPLLRREISSKGAEFLSEIQDMLSRGPVKGLNSKVKNTSSVTVTICYHEELGKSKRKTSNVTRRRNFRRS
jgi:hypothetical protein